MQQKSNIWVLQKIFQFIGGFILLVLVSSILMKLHFYFFLQSETGPTQELFRYNFELLQELRLVFASLAFAFFALLVASTFGMIFKLEHANFSLTNRFLHLSCLGFCLAGLFGCLDLFFSFQIYGANQSSLFILPQILSLFSQLFFELINFVYAISIYILFRHFSGLITFESEIV